MRNVIFVCLYVALATFFATSTLAQKPIQLLFVGDVMAHSPQIESTKKANGTYDFNPWFTEVQSIISSADMAVANLELTLPGKPPYTGYPQFRAPDVIADALRTAGFDLLVTANNHSNDGGLLGITHTLDVLDELGLQHTGTFRREAEKQALYPLLVYQGEYKICFVNYTYDTNGIPTPSPAKVNLIDTAAIKLDLEKARALNPDYIIAVMHWGLEYQLTENAVQRDIAKLLLRHGADMVMGSHPHVVQPLREETVTRLDGSTYKGLVVYSMGNFISNQQKPHTDGGLMVQVNLAPKPGGGLVLQSYKPIEVCRLIAKDAAGRATYRVIPCTPDLPSAPGATAAQVTAMRNFSTAIRKRLGF